LHDDVVDSFHQLYYDTSRLVTAWLGVRIVKCPLDMWVFQDILYRTRPDLIIETGTARGGSAYFMACICDLIGNGRILTIDVRDAKKRPKHPRITYVQGSSVDPAILDRVRASISPGEKVMVTLDSDHAEDHVYAELQKYPAFVTKGNYLIVEDTNVNGHPVYPDHGPGPMEALERFLAETDEFEVDESCERFLLTLNPSGFLRRV
jgi:cephalosporin hydroxylase